MTSIVRNAAALSTAATLAVDGATFREGMSCFAEAVTIVTTDGPAGLAGATATAVTSVSDNPPTILVCLNRTSKSAPRFVANGVFCVNALKPEHRELADVFAGRTGLHLEERFGKGEWSPLSTGAPALVGAAVALDCRIVDIKDVATHHVMIGEVVGVRMGPQAASLVYVHRSYRTV